MEEIETALQGAKQAKDRLEQISPLDFDMPNHLDAKIEFFDALNTLHIRWMRYNSHMQTCLGAEMLEYLNQTIGKLMLSENRKKYFVDPGTNFTRNRKCPRKDLIHLLTGSGRRSLDKELFYFYREDDVITASGFDQQRSKLKPEGVQFIFDEFSRTIYEKDRHAAAMAAFNQWLEQKGRIPSGKEAGSGAGHAGRLRFEGR